jgi:hypothetical protein
MQKNKSSMLAVAALAIIAVIALIFVMPMGRTAEEPFVEIEEAAPSGPVMVVEQSAVGPWTVATYEILQTPDGTLSAMLTFDTANSEECADFVKQAQPWLTMCNVAATQGYPVIMQGVLVQSYQDTTVYDGMLARTDTSDEYRAAFIEAPFDSYNMRMSPVPGNNLDQAQNFFFDADANAARSEILRIEEMREKG